MGKKIVFFQFWSLKNIKALLKSLKTNIVTQYLFDKLLIKKRYSKLTLKISGIQIKKKPAVVYRL